MAVEITVRCYGPARHEAGAETLRVLLPSEGTVADVLRSLEADPATSTGLVQLLPHCAVAIDDELVPKDHPVTGEHEVALLPPVAGG